MRSRDCARLLGNIVRRSRWATLSKGRGTMRETDSIALTCMRRLIECAVRSRLLGLRRWRYRTRLSRQGRDRLSTVHGPFRGHDFSGPTVPIVGHTSLLESLSPSLRSRCRSRRLDDALRSAGDCIFLSLLSVRLCLNRKLAPCIRTSLRCRRRRLGGVVHLSRRCDG